MRKQSPLDQICTPKEASELIGVSEERVLQFCRQGRFGDRARQFGRGWLIEIAAAKEMAKTERPSGIKFGAG